MKTIHHEMRQLEMKSKREALSDQIARLACRLGAGARLPRVLEMCREFNVATHTLNHALREVEAQGLIRRQRGAGIFVTESAVLLANQAPIALICRPSLFRMAGHSPIWDILAEMIQKRAETAGVHFDCYFSREPGSVPPLSPAVQNAIEEHHIGGVLGVGLPEEGAFWIMSRGVPVVNLFSRGSVTVNLDNVSLVRCGVEALHRRGCQRVALWLSVPPLAEEEQVRDSHQEARRAFRDALKERGLSCVSKLIEDNHIWFDAAPEIVPPNDEQGFAIAQRVFSQPRAQWPDGIVLMDDTITEGVLAAMAEMGVEVGRDVQIASHTNVGSPLLRGHDLDLFEIDPQEIVTVMFEHIERLMQNPPDDWRRENNVFIPAHLRETPRTPVSNGISSTRKMRKSNGAPNNS